jgi:3'-phosphoadenosine 5'-phosphosulfate sulfotransferase (PAPS reductase)/FAD synthetase
LITPLLVLVVGVQPVVAIGTDLAYGAITKTVGGWRHLRSGAVDLGEPKWLAVGSFGGARQDEERSRAKERIFSFRSAQHRWDRKNQRPELWSVYNARKRRGESIRVSPLSNWTELDVWHYICRERIPVVLLHLAADAIALGTRA